MNSDSEHSKSVILFASVIIPELEGNNSLKENFLINYWKLFSDVDKESQKKIRLLVSVISFLSLVYNLSSFSALSYAKRQAYINKLFHFPVKKLVGGLTGLRALSMISYYNIEEVMSEINYDGPIK